jgi:hypothetical protein
MHPNPLEDFKALLSLDDRENALSRYCLVMATYTMEQYYERRFVCGKRFEFFPSYGDYLFPLRDYPVRKLLTVCRTHALQEAVVVDPALYHTIPDCGNLNLSLSAFRFHLRCVLSGNCRVSKCVTGRGYVPGSAPPDLASACLELAAWNMGRCWGRRIGLTGAVRGKGADGEHLEAYRRKMI